MLTRRHAILVGAGAAASALRLSAADFWEDKPPSEWTDKQVEKLLTNSPWAKETSVEFRGGSMDRARGPMGGPGMGGPGMGGPGMGGPGMGGPGMGGPGVGGPGAGGPGMGQGPIPGGGGPVGGPDERMPGPRTSRVLVRWESALPVHEAEKRAGGQAEKADNKQAAGSGDSDNYLISVAGLPMTMSPDGQSNDGGGLEQRREAMLERLKSSASLQRKGKDPIAATRVQEAPGPHSALLFVFPRGADPITLDDKEVTFLTEAGPMQIKAKFPLKNMKYQGKLEL